MKIDELQYFVENNPKLVSKRESLRYPGLYVIKYTRKVFYDGLWNDILEECRGLVVDKDWNVIVRPFKKIYNRGENGMDFHPNDTVTVVEKLNGFMAAVTYNEKYGPIVSTTGSLDSDYVDLAHKHLINVISKMEIESGYTHLFEICDESDPHIIEEEPGAYLIGSREIESGYLCDEDWLDNLAWFMEVKRPLHTVSRYSDVLAGIRMCRHEGYVVRRGDQTALKIKTPYYLATKFLARMKGEKLIERINNGSAREILDEEYYPLLNRIENDGLDSFIALSEQERIEKIRNYFYE